MNPVRPMPPAVAQNSSGSASGVTVCGSACSAPGKRMSKLVTWLANDPATWWFLPCTSAAIAPPTVTWRVPGETGTNQPCGSPATMSCSRETPASATTTPVAGSRLMMLVQPAGGDDQAARGLRRVVVAAAEAARDHGGLPAGRSASRAARRSSAAASASVAGAARSAVVGAIRPQPVSLTLPGEAHGAGDAGPGDAGVLGMGRILLTGPARAPFVAQRNASHGRHVRPL